MITTPTVLVLGAGASVHVDYPLGGSLIDDLCRQRDLACQKNPSVSWSNDEVDHFLTRLSRAGHSSIDAFLETVPAQSDLGKYLIAREMKRHEDINRLFPPHNSGWYRYLFNSLLGGDGAPAFAESRLSIITFNYDRSLKVYLHEALKARFEMSSDEASTTLSNIPIIHVHGSLGPYPEIPYQSGFKTDEILEISKQIQIIHEVSDREDGFCSPEFKQAHELLSSAERIFFLGFGFHPDNIRRLRFFIPENTKGRSIIATTAGMGPIEIKNLDARLQPLGFSSSALNGNTCNNFFTHVAAL